MGTILQSTPLLISLKESFPNAHLVFVSATKNKAILEEIKCIDQLLLVKDRSFFSGILSLLQILFLFWKKRPDLYFDLEVYSRFSTSLTALSLARRRYGIREGSDPMREAIYTYTADFLQQPVISEAYLSLASQAGAAKLHHQLIRFTGSESAEFRQLSGPYLVVNPNASDLRLERRWPSKNYALLIGMLLDHAPEHTVVISGSASERAHVQTVINEVDKKYANRILDASGQLSMKAFIAMIARCELMLTNDSGPMHLAMALQIPFVALFGPGSPIHYAMPARATVITKNIHCSPCVHLHPESPCGGDNQCMKQITVPEVFEACRKHLQTAMRESQVLAMP